jgi:DnaK suppressor protein
VDAAREAEEAIGLMYAVAKMVAPSDDLDLEAIRRELGARRDVARERLAVLASRPERGTALGFGKRVGDGTTEAVSRLTDIGVGGSLERALARTERAVAKLDDGSYGICDVCGDPIPAGRLRALPDAVWCIRCAESQRRASPPQRR